MVGDFRSACSNPGKLFEQKARTLYRILVRPAASAFSNKRRMVISPDGPLWDLPFAALIVSDRRSTRARGQKNIAANSSAVSPCFLLDRFEIDYAFSASSARAARDAASDRKKHPSKRTVLVMANPDFGDDRRFGDDKSIPGQRPIDTPSRPIDIPSRPIDSPSRPIDVPSRAIEVTSRSILLRAGNRIANLPGTQREADAIGRLFPGARVLTRSQAQESTAVAESGDYHYIHFATHGFFNDAAPMLSSIVLADPGPPAPNPGGVSFPAQEDGFLTAREIFDLKLNAEMVVLSACNTARGEKRSGEGVVGLTWALFAAGCPTQVVSQWSVDDSSTATLMERFYSGIAKGRPKGESLRSAALSLLNQARKSKNENRKYAHPYYWAPFILMGDWR
jgi:CHAT domain-containing protein